MFQDTVRSDPKIGQDRTDYFRQPSSGIALVVYRVLKAKYVHSRITESSILYTPLLVFSININVGDTNVKGYGVWGLPGKMLIHGNSQRTVLSPRVILVNGAGNLYPPINKFE